MKGRQHGERHRSLLPIVVLAAIFIGPFVAAVFWEPDRFMNYGKLVEPPRPMQAVALSGLDGTPIAENLFRGRWTYVYFSPPECAEKCRQALIYLRQVRLAAGKDRQRVRYVFVVTAGTAVAGLRRAHPQGRLVTGAPDVLSGLAEQFASASAGRGRIYLVDPLGNLMMSYPRDADPSRMRKDLARLLKVSKIG